MKEQNFSNHSRLVPLYHFILVPLVLAMIAGSVLNFKRHYDAGLGLLIPSLLILTAVILFLVTLFTRSFALKAQDRAIRAEENLRYFAVTGSLPDQRLTIQQIIALRFASPNELLDLTHRAVNENLSPKDIKKAIKNWKGDYYRV